MSEQEKAKPSALDKFQKQLEEDAQLKQYSETSKKKASVQEKRLLVDDYKLTQELERIRSAEDDLKRADSVNVEFLSDESISDIQLKTKLYLEGAKNGMMFLNNVLGKFVPAWPGNIIVIGSRTGGGKSSVAANLIYTTIQQKNKVTSRNRKVLIISSEETSTQVYSRLTCLAKNYDYNQQDDFTDEQKQDLIDFIPRWAKAGITVIGEDGSGITRTLEGVKSILHKMEHSKDYYDLILIDYIQKINSSKKNSNMKGHEVMREVMSILDDFKNRYPAPIVVLTQLSSQNEEGTLDFQERLRGCHDIITPATVALELVADRKNLRSQWIIHKNRYKGAVVGQSVWNAYDNGHFKPMTEEWEKYTKNLNEQKQYKETLGKVFDGKEENKEKEE